MVGPIAHGNCMETVFRLVASPLRSSRTNPIANACRSPAVLLLNADLKRYTSEAS